MTDRPTAQTSSTSRRQSGQPEFSEVLFKLGHPAIWTDQLEAVYALLYGPAMRTRELGWRACEQLRQFLAGLPNLLDVDPRLLVTGETQTDARFMDDESEHDMRTWSSWQTQLHRRQLMLVAAPADEPAMDDVAEWLAALVFDDIDRFLTARLRHLYWSSRPPRG